MESDWTMTDFLVVYDYGQGGFWAIVRAESPVDVQSRFPELTLVPDRPAWMSDQVLSDLHDEVLNVRQPTGLLSDILRERGTTGD
jgi:hypothetical protein